MGKRLYEGATKLLDYSNVPTTVFTPLEYGAIGMPEEDAIAKYGEDGIEVYHQYHTPLEWTVPHRPENKCYCKLVVEKATVGRCRVGVECLFFLLS